ncbi:hypothetical protein BD779DRAFT_1567742 [Infundibulicybe gibba]|nr:hypothetical protein BD779DRAFT_1567742 [Infundibulicybe gibba]
MNLCSTWVTPAAAFPDEALRHPNQLLAPVGHCQSGNIMFKQSARPETSRCLRRCRLGVGYQTQRGIGANAEGLSSINETHIPQPREADHDAVVVVIPHGNPLRDSSSRASSRSFFYFLPSPGQRSSIIGAAFWSLAMWCRPAPLPTCTKVAYG